MKISATSALVLNWTAEDVWKSAAALNYSKGMDLSEGDALLSIFSNEEHYMHLQAVSNRKYFVRKKALAFMETCNAKGLTPQVIILAAGIAPLSVELASLVPDSKIFDVDQFLMRDKEKYLNGSLPQIKFISCDITDTALLNQELQEAGWDNQMPTLVVMEGIIYYLSEAALKNILDFFSGYQAALAADFALLPERVSAAVRIFGTEVFRKIKETIGLSHIQYYDPSYFLQMIAEHGFPNPHRTLLSEIQQEFRNKTAPFEGTEPGWINLVASEYNHQLLL